MLHNFRNVRLSAGTSKVPSSASSASSKHSKSGGSGSVSITPRSVILQKKRPAQPQQKLHRCPSAMDADLGLKSVVVQRKLNNRTNYSLREVRKKITASNGPEEEEEEVGAVGVTNSSSGSSKLLKRDRRRSRYAGSDEDEEDDYDGDNYDNVNDDDDDDDEEEDDYDDDDGSGNSPNWTTTTTTTKSAKWADSSSWSAERQSPPQQNVPSRKRGAANARLMLTTKSRKVRFGWYDKGGADEFKVAREGDPDFRFIDPDERGCFNERKAWAGNYVMCIGQTNLCKWM